MAIRAVGKPLLAMPVNDFLDVWFSFIVENMDSEQREDFDKQLARLEDTGKTGDESMDNQLQALQDFLSGKSEQSPI